MLGYESSALNVGRILSLHPSSQNERDFGLMVLLKAGKENEKYKYLGRLFAALSLVSFSDSNTSTEKVENVTKVADLLVQAVELEKAQGIEEAALVVKYLVNIDYFDSDGLKTSNKTKLFQIAEQTLPYYCYMEEALTRNLYRLPKSHDTLTHYKTECEKLERLR